MRVNSVVNYSTEVSYIRTGVKKLYIIIENHKGWMTIIVARSVYTICERLAGSAK